MPPLPATSQEQIDRAINELERGARRLATSSLDERLELLKKCIETTSSVAREWVQRACEFKQIPMASAAVAEEVLSGPGPVLRFLWLMCSTLESIRDRGQPSLPGSPRFVKGQMRVPVFPTKSLFDSIVFVPMTAETWLQSDVKADAIFGDAPDRLARRTSVTPGVTLVLGAGNVAAIPATDALTMIFQNDCTALIKMNPVNECLGPIFERAFDPLVRAGFMRIVYGGADVGTYGVNHPKINSVHLTGSIDTHDAIVWGAVPSEREFRRAAGTPLLTKPVTSELGNVTPWVIVPGDYSPAQLTSQAETIAASITNNVSFNCIATKVIVTAANWPQRERFLDELESILHRIPTRYPYYPGATERFERYSGGCRNSNDGASLPWIVRRGIDPRSDPHLLEKESFVCVTAETTLEGSTSVDFLNRAVDFMNERISGTLAASVTVPDSFRKTHARDLDDAVRRMEYGTVGVNQWSGVAYGLMSPPWGAFPGAPLEKIQSGSGFVHNTYLLNRPQKVVLNSPLTLMPKPVWFSTNRRVEQITWKLADLYSQPSIWNLAKLLSQALRG
jgi:acyl-CoA reductase-like NAD-dependent aldehyde dehydrogenase